MDLISSHKEIDINNIIRELNQEEFNTNILVEIVLNLRNLNDLLYRIHNLKEILTPEDIANKYHPLKEDYESVVAWVNDNGIKIKKIDSNHRIILIEDTIQNLSNFFNIQFSLISHNNDHYISSINSPIIPDKLSDLILSVNGLQTHIKFTPRSISTLGAAPYIPSDINVAYNIPSTLTGSGQTIAIIGGTYVNTTDLSGYWSLCGISQSLSNLTQTNPLGANQNYNTSWGEEIALDTELASSYAPGSKIHVYSSATTVTGINTILSTIYSDAQIDPTLRIVNICFAGPEVSFTPSFLNSVSSSFALLVALGCTILVASGDGGSNPDSSGGVYNSGNTLSPEYPASDPQVTGVGGTSLTLNSSGVITAETAWTPSQGGAGTGGGISTVFNKPVWQGGTGIVSASMRGVPDVAACADQNLGTMIYYNGAQTTIGGTSIATPIWAGILALINQARGLAGLGTLANLASYVYNLIGSGLSPFRDITSGNNGNYTAHAGWDCCTGVGSPNVTQLIIALGGWIPIAIKTQPTNQTGSYQGTATFSVAINTCYPNATFQWRKNSVNINTSLYPSAATATYTLRNLLGGEADNYDCVITNSAGSVTTNSVSLTVTGVPTFLKFPSAKIPGKTVLVVQS